MDGKRIPLTTATTGNFNGDVAGTVKAGASVSIFGPAGGVVNGTLASLVIVDAETNTLTLSAYWQVSEDGSTWYDVAGTPSNPANVVLATGTAGADAAVTKVLPAPAAVYAWTFARVAVVNGVATGAATDTYSIQYKYVRGA
jgi:hypothetical protein